MRYPGPVAAKGVRAAVGGKVDHGLHVEDAAVDTLMRHHPETAVGHGYVGLLLTTTENGGLPSESP